MGNRIYAFLIFLLYLNISSTAQNVGIGTATPNTKLDVNGSFSMREGSALNLLNGNNNNVSLSSYSFYRVSGPTAAFSITGLSGGTDGRVLTLLNESGQSMTISNQSTLSTTTNRIKTQTGNDLIIDSLGGSACFQYNATVGRWIVTDIWNANNVGWLLNGNKGTSASNNFIGTIDANDFVTRTNNTERMRITSTGNVGIGTNAQAINNNNSTAVGISAQAINGANASAFGYAATSNGGQNATAIGASSQANQQDATALGYNTRANYQNAIAIGSGAALLPATKLY